MHSADKIGRKGVILVGEDEPEVRKYLDVALRCYGYEVEFAENGFEVVNLLRQSQRPVSAVLLDVIMPRMDGIQALREIRQFNRDLPVIILSSAFSPVQVVEAMKSGATDFLPKPITHEQLCNTLKKALEGSWKKPAATAEPYQPEKPTHFVAGKAAAEFANVVAKVAPTDLPLLIQGETGTGKEVLARYLHENSRRAKKPFLKLNCAALPSELVESELFGYERGAFTGAFQKKAGMFELADGGTLLLDEIGDMDVKLQSKLLQVLQDQTFQHLGGRETVHVDVRVIAATHRNLEDAIIAGTFREDLYYRLNVISLQLPPLRERRDEIIPLAELLMRKHAAPGATVPPTTEEMHGAMVDYEWFGNVRELENFVRKFLILGDAQAATHELRLKKMRRSSVPALTLVTKDTPRAVPDSRILEKVSKAKEQAETETILSALQSTRWNRKQAALLLGIEYKALLYKMKKLCIEQMSGTPRGQSRPESWNEDAMVPPDAIASRPAAYATAGSGD
jgi:two-component system, NtrC family, response regulator AtoC